MRFSVSGGQGEKDRKRGIHGRWCEEEKAHDVEGWLQLSVLLAELVEDLPNRLSVPGPKVRHASSFLTGPLGLTWAGHEKPTRAHCRALQNLPIPHSRELPAAVVG